MEILSLCDDRERGTARKVNQKNCVRKCEWEEIATKQGTGFQRHMWCDLHVATTCDHRRWVINATAVCLQRHWHIRETLQHRRVSSTWSTHPWIHHSFSLYVGVFPARAMMLTKEDGCSSSFSFLFFALGIRSFRIVFATRVEFLMKSSNILVCAVVVFALKLCVCWRS